MNNLETQTIEQFGNTTQECKQKWAYAKENKQKHGVAFGFAIIGRDLTIISTHTHNLFT